MIPEENPGSGLPVDAQVAKEPLCDPERVQGQTRAQEKACSEEACTAQLASEHSRIERKSGQDERQRQRLPPYKERRDEGPGRLHEDVNGSKKQRGKGKGDIAGKKPPCDKSKEREGKDVVKPFVRARRAYRPAEELEGYYRAQRVLVHAVSGYIVLVRVLPCLVRDRSPEGLSLMECVELVVEVERVEEREQYRKKQQEQERCPAPFSLSGTGRPRRGKKKLTEASGRKQICGREQD